MSIVLWLGSAPSADHVRRAADGVRRGVAGPGVAARSGTVPALAVPRRRSSRQRSAGGDSGGGLHRLAVRRRRDRRRRVSKRTWRSQPTRRRREARSIGPRRIVPTPVRRRSWRSLLGNEELDREANRSLRLDEVLDIRRDALRLTHVDDARRSRVSFEPRSADGPDRLADDPTFRSRPGEFGAVRSAWSLHPTSPSFERPRGRRESRCDRTAGRPTARQPAAGVRRRR